MPTRRNIPYNSGVYFITFTNYKWLSLFEITQSYDLVFKWFSYLKEKGNYIIGYVIMPNHLHIIIAFRKSKQTINTIIGNGKRFLAYGIIERLKQNNQTKILETLEQGVKSTDKKRGKLYEVFEESFDWKECTSDRLIKQKLEYIHNNPSAEKSNLSINPSDYKYSSAKFYVDEIEDEYATNYMELHDVNLEQTYAESLSGDSAEKCETIQEVENTNVNVIDFPAESLAEDSAPNRTQIKNKSEKTHAESLSGDSAVKCETIQEVENANINAIDLPAESLAEDSAPNRTQIKNKSEKTHAESLSGDSTVKCETIQEVENTNVNVIDFPAESLAEDSATGITQGQELQQTIIKS